MNTAKQFDMTTGSNLHGPFAPADVRDGEAVYAHIYSLDKENQINQQFRVWRISPLGVEIVIDHGMSLEKGLHVSMDLQLGVQKTHLSGLVVDSIEENKGRQIAHIRIVPKNVERVEGVERREKTRWMCSNQFFPTAVASNPAKFNDFIYFKVCDISYGGFKLQTSLRNKFIIPGISFECIMNFPMISQVNIKIVVQNVRVDLEAGHEVLTVGVTFDTKNENFVKIVGQYLMQFGSVQSLTDIQNSGFLIHSVSDAVSYSYVKTKEEFEDVLKLRFHAYNEAGKVQPDKTHLDMSDQFDAKSRIVIGKYKGEIVCSARMIFHQVGESLEQEKFVKWPSSQPRQDEVVEIMRACTRPDFRGSDLLLGMFKYMAVTVAQAKKNWIVICATDEMVPFYQKIGFKLIDLSYPHTGLNGIIHHILVANFVDGMAGRTTGPIYWNLAWSEAVDYMSTVDMFEVDPFMQVRLTIYKWFAPVASFLFTRKIKRRLSRIKEKQAASQAIKTELKAA